MASAPRASAVRKPKAKPPAPPRLVSEGTYTARSPATLATKSSTALSAPLSTTKTHCTGWVWWTTCSKEARNSSTRLGVTMTAAVEPVELSGAICGDEEREEGLAVMLL